MERFTNRSIQIAEWGEINAQNIEDSLERYRKRILTDYPELKDRFEPSRRTLSEMELCYALTVITPPMGYERVTRTIQINDGNDHFVGEHTFFSRKGAVSEIICLTPGQLIQPLDESLNKGERSQILMDKGGSLVTKLSDELVMIYGTKGRIRDALNIDF